MNIINPYRFGVAASLLLDTYTGAAAAYSLRKLRTAYTGYCIEVRRSSDDTTQNIGFVNNVLDESSLTTFCGAGNGFVKTWYDQVGSNNVTQGTTANQPQIVSSGSVLTENSKPAIYFDITDILSVNFTAINQPDTIIMVVKFAALNSYNFIIDGYGSTNRQAIYLNNSSNYFIMYAISNSRPVSNNTKDTNQNIIIGLFNGSSSRLYKNGTEGIPEYADIGTSSLGGITIGNIYSGNFGDQYFQECIVYPSDQTSNIAVLNTAINSFYSCY